MLSPTLPSFCWLSIWTEVFEIRHPCQRDATISGIMMFPLSRSCYLRCAAPADEISCQ